MDFFVGIDTQQVLKDTERIAEKFKSLAPEMQDTVVDEVSDFLLDVMRTYPRENHDVTRQQAYGRTFESDKQRRWFFANLDSGELILPYRRTQEMRESWRKEGEGRSSFLVNDTQAAFFTMDPKGQSRMAKMQGWKTTKERIEEHSKGMVKRAEAAIKKAIKNAGLDAK